MKIYRFLGKDCRITIPLPLRKMVDIRPGDLLSFEETEDGAGVIVHLESICDCCADEYWEDPEDDDNDDKVIDISDHLDNDDEDDDDEERSLLDFLDALSPEEQRAALIRLSINLGRYI